MIVVFAGPSLHLAAAREVLAADYRPPALNGDVVRAVRDGARVIAIIDGGFDWTLAVWHKEILWAMSEGVHVHGAASMGALRAAELDGFGMRGVGRVYELFRDGVLEDDDEVAVVHAARAPFDPISDAMVNIRATLAVAARSGVIGAGTRRRLSGLAKRAFYPQRSYDALLARGREAGLPPAELDRLTGWLDANRVDLKCDDALALVRELAARFAGDRWPPPRFEPPFTLVRSPALERLLARAGGR